MSSRDSLTIPRLGNFVIPAGFYGDLGLYEMSCILPYPNSHQYSSMLCISQKIRGFSELT